jgi:KAP family P-loop domain
VIRKLLPDMPTANPALGFGEVALALVRLLSQTTAPPVIGVTGPPGSGRTTFLQLVEAELDADHFVSVQLSAATPNHSSDQPALLVEAIVRALEERADDTRATELATEFARLTGTAHTHSTTDGPQHGPLAARPHRPLHLGRQAHGSHAARAGASASEGERRLVVLVDDAEAVTAGAISVVHRLLAELGAVCVVACDELTSVSPAAERLLGVTYRMPLVGRDQLTEFVEVTLAEADLPGHQAQELQDRVVPFLDHVVAEHRATPRALKRFINAYILAREIDHESRLDPDALLAALTIATRASWRPAWNALLLYQDAFIAALGRRSHRDGSDERELDDLWLMPDSLLRFFDQGHAAALLAVDAVEPYLASVPASCVRVPLEALRTLGALRISLDVLRDTPDPIGETRLILAECGSLSSALAALLPACATASVLLQAIRALHDRELSPHAADRDRLQAVADAAQACTRELLGP